jgi:hypothetical protein
MAEILCYSAILVKIRPLGCSLLSDKIQGASA